MAQHTSVEEGEGDSTYSQYVAALRKKEQLSAAYRTGDQRATLLEQLVSYFSLSIPNVAHQQQLVILKQEASKARLAVTALVHTIYLHTYMHTRHNSSPYFHTVQRDTNY